MSADDWVLLGLCLAVIVTFALIIRHCAEADRRRWQASTSARTTDPTPAVPPAALCTAEENAAFERIIAAEYPSIPSQTRRPGKDQP